MSTSCIEPKGSTFSPENPRRWILTGSSFSLPMHILSKAIAKMMSAELPLSTKTRWIILLATTALITKGSSWGCWHPSRSESENVMVVSSHGSLDTSCTSITSPNLMLRKWAFLTELDSLPPANPPEITWISPKGYFLPKLYAIVCSMPMVPMELTILGVISLGRGRTS